MLKQTLPRLAAALALIPPIVGAALFFSGIAFGQAPPPVPALPDSERRTSYSISATTCVCSVGFQLYGDSTDVDQWIEVWVAGVRRLSTDAAVGWSLSSATGPIATIPRPITDAVLTFNFVQTGTVQIVGARRPRRAAQFQENRGVPARDLNQALTDIVAQNRETWDRTNDVAGRTLRAPPGETFPTLPPAASRAGATLGFDGSGNPIPVTGFIGPQGPTGATGPTGAAGPGTAPTVSYTSPGTSAVVSTVQARLANELWATDFGAVCNSVTNDQPAFSNMIAAGVALGIGTHFTGRCAIATAIPINGIVSFEGSSKGTAILLVPVAQNAIVLNGATYSRIEHMEIFNNGACASTDGVFAISATNHSDYITIDDVLINCTANGISFSSSGGFNITNTLIGLGNQAAIGVLIGTGTVDSANGRINNSIITNAATPPSTAVAVVCESCAGLRFLNNDINGVFNIGLQIFTINVQDGDLLVAHNNIEGIYGSAVNIARSDVVSFFGDYSFVNNEFSGPQCFIMNTDATGPWVLALNVVGNICNGANTSPAWFFNSVWGVTFTGNTSWVAAGVANVFFGSAVDRALIGPNICVANPVSNANKYTSNAACAANTNNATNSSLYTPY